MNASTIQTMPMRTSLEPAEVLVERCAAIGRDVAGPRAERTDQEATWPSESLSAIQGAGLGGLVVPRNLGGLGHGLETLARACEAIGQHCSSSALCFGMHCVASAVISAKVTATQQSGVLEAICRGEHLSTLSLSEPGTGAHFYVPRTQLRTDPAGGYRVNGIKTFVTNGGHADSYVLSAVAAGEDAAPGEFSCVLVPIDAPGIEWGPDWEGIGMRGNSSRSMKLDDVLVPEENLLGEEGDQIWYVFHVVAPYFLMAMSGTYLGIASAAVEEARAHLSRRVHEHDGRSLAEFDVLQHRLGEIWTKVERTRQLVYHAGRAFDGGADNALLSLVGAKADVADCVVEVVNEAMTLTGGIGYREGGKLQRLLRDARAAHVMAPTTDILRVWAGRILLGRPILGG